jgi:hypothetical protein
MARKCFHSLRCSCRREHETILDLSINFKESRFRGGTPSAKSRVSSRSAQYQIEVLVKTVQRCRPTEISRLKRKSLCSRKIFIFYQFSIENIIKMSCHLINIYGPRPKTNLQRNNQRARDEKTILDG